MTYSGAAGAKARRWPRLDPGVSVAIAATLGLRVGLLVFGFLVWAQVSTPGPCNFELARDGWTTIPPLNDQGLAVPFIGVWQHWDACWYGKIATFGYEPGTDATAFFPLFPALTAVISMVVGGNVALAGMILNTVAIAIGLAGIHRLVTLDFGRRVAERTVFLIVLFPAAFFLAAPFTEAVFLATATWALVGARERAWLLAGTAAAMAALTRWQGVLLVLPLAWEAWSALRERRGPTGSSADRGAFAERTELDDGTEPAERGEIAERMASLGATLAPALALGAFVFYTSATVGRSVLDAQDAWGGRSFHWPWEVAEASIRWIVDRSEKGIQALNLGTLALFGGLGILGLRRLPVVYSLYLWPPLLLLATRIQPTPLTSTTRYLVPLFPAFVMAALLSRNRHVAAIWVVLSALLSGFLAYLFVTGTFVA